MSFTEVLKGPIVLHQADPNLCTGSSSAEAVKVSNSDVTSEQTTSKNVKFNEVVRSSSMSTSELKTDKSPKISSTVKCKNENVTLPKRKLICDISIDESSDSSDSDYAPSSKARIKKVKNTKKNVNPKSVKKTKKITKSKAPKRMNTESSEESDTK